MVDKEGHLSDNRLQVHVHEMDREPKYVGDIKPAQTAFGGDQLEVVQVEIQLERLVSSKVHIVLIVRDLFDGRDESGCIHSAKHTGLVSACK